MKESSTRPLFPNPLITFLSFLLVGSLCLLFILYVDRPVAYAVESFPPVIKKLFGIITKFGKSTPYLVLFGLGSLLLYYGSRLRKCARHANTLRRLATTSLFLFASVALSGLLVDLLKAIFARYRPVVLYETGKYGFRFLQFSSARVLSFPSGHANTIFALMTGCYLIFPRYWYLYVIIAILVAISRVVVGAHFVSDIIAGAYLGVITTLYLKHLAAVLKLQLFEKRPGR